MAERRKITVTFQSVRDRPARGASGGSLANPRNRGRYPVLPATIGQGQGLVRARGEAGDGRLTWLHRRTDLRVMGCEPVRTSLPHQNAVYLDTDRGPKAHLPRGRTSNFESVLDLPSYVWPVRVNDFGKRAA